MLVAIIHLVPLNRYMNKLLTKNTTHEENFTFYYCYTA